MSLVRHGDPASSDFPPQHNNNTGPHSEASRKRPGQLPGGGVGGGGIGGSLSESITSRSDNPGWRGAGATESLMDYQLPQAVCCAKGCGDPAEMTAERAGAGGELPQTGW